MTLSLSLAEDNMNIFCSTRHIPAGKLFKGKKGFTLIEMAFILVIIGILVGMGAELLPMLVKQSKLKETRAIVKEVKTAITGYALAKGSLPCASTTEDGSEDNGTYIGYLPYADLGINGNDSYQGTLFYAVDPYLADTDIDTPEEFKTALSELINGTPSPDLFCDGTNIKAAFVVFSAGKNLQADAPNDDGNNQFAKPGAPETASYDDILDAVSLTYLYGRFD